MTVKEEHSLLKSSEIKQTSVLAVGEEGLPFSGSVLGQVNGFLLGILEKLGQFVEQKKPQIFFISLLTIIIPNAIFSGFIGS